MYFAIADRWGGCWFSKKTLCIIYWNYYSVFI